MNKTCTKCSEERPSNQFSKNRKSKDGLQAHCKLCVADYYQVTKEVQLYNATMWGINNPERKSANMSMWRSNNIEHELEYRKKYDNENRPARRESSNRWKKNNPDKVNELNQRRNARKKGLTVEKVDYNLIRERDDICYLCQVEFTEVERWDGRLTHVDHIIPLSRVELNPTHSYKNTALVHSWCNLSKKDKTPYEIGIEF